MLTQLRKNLPRKLASAPQDTGTLGQLVTRFSSDTYEWLRHLTELLQDVVGAKIVGNGAQLKDFIYGDGSIRTYPSSPEEGQGYYFGVGTLASDGQHGNRGGGGIHTAATALANGFATPDMYLLAQWLDPTPRLLDTLSCPVNGAYSLVKKLSRNWLGPCFVVRRDSDNAYCNIGFVRATGLMDTSALGTFCSGANGYVVQVYDQSGRGYHLTKSTASGQPKIYDSSTGLQKFGVFDHYDGVTGLPVFTDGTQPACRFDGVDDELKLFGGNNALFGLGGSMNTSVSPDLTVACTHAIRSDWRNSAGLHPTIYDFHSVNGLWLGRNSATVPNPPRDTALALSAHFNATATVWWDVTNVNTFYRSLLQIAAGGSYDSATIRSGFTLSGTASATVSLTGTSTPGTATFSLGSDAGTAGTDNAKMDWNLLIVVNAAALTTADSDAITTAELEHAA